ncbi:General substrate transporter [Teratosphaeria destructans]|uniref:General substrate transporter n=1 Tax=Teratosphaeria destructans TaxID=418781 RepID=A0A9W7SMI8_9PEZI|nr:General substrate transporter [Teratosphaeria destructans]
MLLIIFGTLGTILMPWDRGFPHQGIVAWMFVFRFITGMGTGGDYLMTSSISAERGLKMSASKVVLTIFASHRLGWPYIEAGDVEKLQYVWGLLLGIGLLPLFCTLHARWTIKETDTQKAHVMREGEKRSLGNQFTDFRKYFHVLRHGLALFGTMILQLIGYGKVSTIFETLWHTAVGNVIVSVAGYTPGYYLAIPLPDKIGRIRQQFTFSCIVGFLYALWAGVLDGTTPAGLVVLFTLSQLFINMGPQATTFLLPVEAFPTSVRGTAHGIAAASGKCGAVLTAFGFGTVKDKIGLEGVLGLFAAIMFLVASLSLLIPETKDYSIEEIEQDRHYRGGGLACCEEVSRQQCFEQRSRRRARFIPGDRT